MSTLREDAESVVESALGGAHPRVLVPQALAGLRLYGGRLRVLSIGKAAYCMAKAAWDSLGGQIEQGMIILPHGYATGHLPRFTTLTAGYPATDESSVFATDAAIAMAQGLGVEDTLLVLCSGGVDSLFDKPLIPMPLFETTMNALACCGASAAEIGVIRNRLSAVRAGRFARLCAPAGVVGLVLCDVLSDNAERLVANPISPDPVTAAEAEQTLNRLLPDAPDVIRTLMRRETPKTLSNAETHLIGGVTQLVRAAARQLQRLGYETLLLTERLDCEAGEAGRFLASIAHTHQKESRSVAFVAGGEAAASAAGAGSRNLELALAAVPVLDGLRDTALLSLSSDGFDGASEAAGAYVDFRTLGRMRTAGVNFEDALASRECDRALRASDSLLTTGATGTAVNDFCALMIRR